MQFDLLDEHMRSFEQTDDFCDAPYRVVRLDGRGFTKLTALVACQKPYDAHFSGIMRETMRSLFEAGFRVLYGYTQSDEISLLLHPDDDTFSRKNHKILTVLAGHASARFSMLFGYMGTFDARIIGLPDKQCAVDYFRWRQADAQRNAENGLLYWTLRNRGESKRGAHDALVGKDHGERITMMADLGVSLDAYPLAFRNGIGMYKDATTKYGINPQTNQIAQTTRIIPQAIEMLSDGDVYGVWLANIIAAEEAGNV